MNTISLPRGTAAVVVTIFEGNGRDISNARIGSVIEKIAERWRVCDRWRAFAHEPAQT